MAVSGKSTPSGDSADLAGKRVRRQWPFYWISQVNGHYVRVLESRLKPIGLDMPRWRVLMSLHEDNHLSVSEIADLAVLKLNTATKIVQRMVVDGLVETRVRQADQRATEVGLTLQGEKLRQMAVQEADKIVAAAFLGMSGEEIKSLNGILEKVLFHLKEI